MKIQLFSDNVYLDFIDSLNEDLNKEKEKTNNDLNNLSVQKQDDINNYNNNFNNQLNTYDELTKNNQKQIDEYKKLETDNQNKQYELDTKINEQNKQKAKEQTDAEYNNAYKDYMTNINPYGQQAEKEAETGLTGSGYSETVKDNMFRTYQNRVSVANKALMDANVQYDNQMAQAKKDNDYNLAKIAYDALQQSYQLTMNAFQFKSDLYNKKNEYDYQINKDYFDRGQTLQNRIDSYNQQITKNNENAASYKEQKRQYDLEYELKRQAAAEEREKNQREYDLAVAKYKEDKRQFDLQYGENDDFTDGGKKELDLNSSIPKTGIKLPNLSSTWARGWFVDNIGKKNMTYRQLEAKLKQGYNNGKGILKQEDVADILAAYGVD